VAEAQPLGARRDEGQENLRRRRVRVLVEAVVLDLPGRVVAELVGEHGLRDAVVEGLRLAGAGRIGGLHLEEQGELHARASSNQRPSRRATKPSAPGRARWARNVDTMALSSMPAMGSPSTCIWPVSWALPPSSSPARRASSVGAATRTTAVGGRGAAPVPGGGAGAGARGSG